MAAFSSIHSTLVQLAAHKFVFIYLSFNSQKSDCLCLFLGGREAKASIRPLVVASFPTEKRVSVPFTHLFEQLVELIT